MYLMRLDDASEYINIDNWLKMEELLSKYCVKPLFGIIPHNEDPELLRYGKTEEFWNIALRWIKKGWAPALHGFSHVFETGEGGINPVNRKSEFAGVNYDRQAKKIREGIAILRTHGIIPEVFFAPAHTFDLNTINALKEESIIRIISDTPANKPYRYEEMTFVPQQSGHVRVLPFNTVTFCYHPNTMNEQNFLELEVFLKRHSFSEFPLDQSRRKRGIFDILLMKLYYAMHKK